MDDPRRSSNEPDRERDEAAAQAADEAAAQAAEEAAARAAEEAAAPVLPTLDARANSAVAGARRAVAERLTGGAGGRSAGAARVSRREAGRRRRVTITAVAAVVVLVVAAVLVARQFRGTDVTVTSPQGLPYLVPATLPHGLKLQAARVQPGDAQRGPGLPTEVPGAVCGELDQSNPVAHPAAAITGMTRSRFDDPWSSVLAGLKGSKVEVGGAPGNLSHISGSDRAQLSWVVSATLLLRMRTVGLSDASVIKLAGGVSQAADGALHVDPAAVPAGLSCLTKPTEPSKAWQIAYRSKKVSLTVEVSRGSRATLLSEPLTSKSRQVGVGGHTAWLVGLGLWAVTGADDPAKLPDLDSKEWVARRVMWLDGGYQVTVEGSGMTVPQLLTAARSLKPVSAAEAKQLEQQAPGSSAQAVRSVVVATQPGATPSWRVSALLRGGTTSYLRVQRATASGVPPTDTPPGCDAVPPLDRHAATLFGVGLNTCMDPPVLVAEVSAAVGEVDVKLPGGGVLHPELRTVPGDATMRVAIAELPAGVTSAEVVVKDHDGAVSVDTTVST